MAQSEDVHMPAPAGQTAPVRIDVVSDVVCPWCYIGKNRLQKAIALSANIPVEVNWRPFFLNPWVPREGIDRKTYLETKFGSVERYAGIAERVAAAAASEGLSYLADKITRQPNTLDCHRLILWARNDHDPAAMKQRLMDLYFAEGADLSDTKTLVAAAAACGMDADLVKKLLASDADIDHVEREANSAKEAGIDGVPCFIFDRAIVVSGAQSPDHLAGAILRAAAERARKRA
jgi:predicted DsbA family dithiol-disulfide isomerase